MTEPTEIKQRLETVRDRIKHAAQKSQRDPADICLLAVSKKFPVSAISAGLDAGQLDFGENYINELRAKDASIDQPLIRWHVIGPIQRRAVSKIPQSVHLIQTLDRVNLLERFARVWATPPPPFLVQVNIGNDPHKAGILAEQVAPFLETIAINHPETVIQGLMTIPPQETDESKTRFYFSSMRKLGEQLVTQGLLPESHDLSMGMSADFENAIEEGSTIVRVGTALFGPRP